MGWVLVVHGPELQSEVYREFYQQMNVFMGWDLECMALNCSKQTVFSLLHVDLLNICISYSDDLN